jgi:tetratricopeptide (TPR) repeat protein
LGETTDLAIRNEAEAKASLERQIAANASLREVLDFFTTDLFDAATSEQRGINLTVVEVLEEADRKIHERSLDRPDVEAALRLAVGNTLSLIGQPQKAVVHLERADELFQKLEHSSSTAFDCRQSFARCLRSLGKRDQARKLLEDLATERWEPDNLQRLRLQLDLHKYQLEGKPLEEQLAAITSTLDESREKLGPSHVITLSFLSAQAEVWFRADKFEEALNVYRQELRENEASLGQNHPNTWNAANNVAITLIRLQRLAEAEEIHRENLRRQLMFRGPRDVGTMGTKHNLSMVLWRQNKRQESVDLLREVLVEKTEALGPVESRTLASLYQIGRMYLELKQFQAGSECFARHLQPFLESARATVQWVDLLTVQGQLKTGTGELDTAAVSLAKAKELLASMGDDGYGFQRKTLQSAEDTLEAAREK